MEYLISVLLIALSACFSGLTLGYFTLDRQTLRRKAKLGDIEARRILPVRNKGNQLLTTLLLGNVAVNAVLSVYLSSLATGIVAATTATALIFLFGEIIPQAAFSRHAMRVGSTAAPFVKMLMFISSPITWPIAHMLDRILGKELDTIYTHNELKALISELENSEHSPLDSDEERIIHGALQFSHTTVREIMTPLENVISYDENQRLNHQFFVELTDHGFSRYPVTSGRKDHIVGILYAKDLLTEDDDITIKETEEAFEQSYLTVRPEAKLDTILSRILKQKKHMAIVKNRNDVALGVVTLEDIIEEIIQVEIEDEDDGTL